VRTISGLFITQKYSKQSSQKNIYISIHRKRSVDAETRKRGGG
jgi:hypothetical protein